MAEGAGRRRRGRAGSRPIGLAGLVLVVAFAAVALAAPYLSPHEPDVRSGLPFESPSGRHLLGTDDVGYDIVSEVIWGARVSLLVGVSAAVLAVAVGGLLGLVAGQRRGWLDAVLMRGVDLALALPFVPLIVVLAAYLGAGLENEVLALTLLLWAHPARVVRSQVLSTRQRLYVTAAKTFGASRAHLLRRHLLPAVTPLLIAEFVRAVTLAILLEATLGFLGLGDPVQRSWGSIVHFATARGAFLTGAWVWWIVPAGLCVALVAAGFAFVGVWLEERVDPRLARRAPGAGLPLTAGA
jgi:peptide/nickel transport system permease protein